MRYVSLLSSHHHSDLQSGYCSSPGHVFCDECITSWKDATAPMCTCPVCRHWFYDGHMVRLYADFGLAPVIEPEFPAPNTPVPPNLNTYFPLLPHHNADDVAPPSPPSPTVSASELDEDDPAPDSPQATIANLRQIIRDLDEQNLVRCVSFFNLYLFINLYLPGNFLVRNSMSWARVKRPRLMTSRRT